MRYATALLALFATVTAAHAEIVATSAQFPSSDTVVLIELHNEPAGADVCLGRTGYPLALLGAGKGLLSSVEKVGVGCWAPDGAGNIVVEAIGYPNGNPLRAVKSIGEFKKTEFFTDWNMRPFQMPAAATEKKSEADDMTLTRVMKGKDGLVITELYDIEMKCPLGAGGKAGSIEAFNYGDGSHERVNGCWVRFGDDVAFEGHMPGGTAPFKAKYAITDFTSVTRSEQ